MDAEHGVLFTPDARPTATAVHPPECPTESDSCREFRQGSPNQFAEEHWIPFAKNTDLETWSS